MVAPSSINALLGFLIENRSGAFVIVSLLVIQSHLEPSRRPGCSHLHDRSHQPLLTILEKSFKFCAPIDRG